MISRSQSFNSINPCTGQRISYVRCGSTIRLLVFLSHWRAKIKRIFDSIARVAGGDILHRVPLSVRRHVGTAAEARHWNESALFSKHCRVSDTIDETDSWVSLEERAAPHARDRKENGPMK